MLMGLIAPIFINGKLGNGPQMVVDMKLSLKLSSQVSLAQVGLDGWIIVCSPNQQYHQISDRSLVKIASFSFPPIIFTVILKFKERDPHELI